MLLKLRSAASAVVRPKKERRKGLPAAAEVVLAVLVGFVTGNSRLLGQPSYMCCAAASVWGKRSPAIFVGALIAFLVNGKVESGLVQLCSLLVIAAIHYIDPLEERRDEPVYLSLVNAGILILFSCVVTVAMPTDIYMASMRMINSLLSACCVFIAKLLIRGKQRKGVFDLSGMNGVLAGMLYILISSVLCSLDIATLNVGRMAGVFMLLQAVRKYRSFGGAVIGALTACGIMICEPTLTRNTLLMATAGLICGAFVQFGVLAEVMSFLIAALISLVAVGVNADTYRMFADLAAGSLLFVLVPLETVRKFGKHISGFRTTPEIVGQTTSSRLALCGEALGEIRRRLDMVTVAMDRQTASRTVAGEVARCICADCPNRELCFNKSDIVKRAFAQLSDIAEYTGSVTPAQAEERLRCCTRPALIAGAFTGFNERLGNERAENIRIRELRGLLAEQLTSMEDILNDLSFRSSQVRSIDTELSARLREHFAVMGYTGAKACVYIDEDLFRRADVYLNDEPDLDTVKVTASVSSLLDCDMSVPDIVTEDGLTRVSFSEVPPYAAHAAVFTASAGGEYSGDSYEIFDLNGCEKYVLLSDGMGTGKRARLDSVFTVSLARKLICSGLSMRTAHRLINSMLRVKGWEESFATMDLMRIDLCGGSASILKAGAVKSRLCRDGSVCAFGGQAFPAGILAECSPDVTDIKLFSGDMIVMTSDGADEDCADEIARIAAGEVGNIEDIVRRMAEYAMAKRDKKHSDDLTIIAVKIELNREI